jgi:serine/threonine-protein kinase
MREQLADYLYAARERIRPAELRAFTAKLLGVDADAAAEMLRSSRPADKPQAPDGGERPSTSEQPVPTVPASPLLPDWGRPTGVRTATARAPAEDPWPEGDDAERSSARRFTPISRPGEAPLTRRRPRTHSDIGRFVSAAPPRPPDSAGDLSVITPMRLLADLALASETGLLHFDRDGLQKEIFVVAGAPESVASGDAGERFGEYLMARDILTPQDLDLALGMLPHYDGKLGDTLVALGMLRPLDVFRLLSEQVRDRVIDVFAWTEGTFAFYRGVTNRHESFPLGLDTFEIMGAGVVNLAPDLLEARFAPLGDLRPTAVTPRRFDPDAFKIGPTPGAVLAMLSGEKTLRDWRASFSDPDERLTFLRTLYLLLETDLAQLD